MPKIFFSTQIVFRLPIIIVSNFTHILWVKKLQKLNYPVQPTVVVCNITLMNACGCREDWVAAIQSVSDRLAESEDVDMKGTNSLSNNTSSESTMEELESKFSVQGTSSSKSTGKKKVVSRRGRTVTGFRAVLRIGC